MTDSRSVLVDGDIIVYRCGFASHRKQYSFIHEGNQYNFRYKKEMVEFMKEKDLPKDYPYEIEETVEPLNHTLHSVKTVINDIAQACKADTIEVILSGSPNWRDSLGTLKKYKGNRDEKHKPEHYNEIREYLQKHFNAQVVTGWEADDELALRQTDNTIIASLDKDLDQIPGWHYNWVKQIEYLVTPDDGEYFYWHQMITGDSTDNIIGLPKYGEKAAEKLLATCSSLDEMEEAVRYEYEKVFDMDTCMQYGYTSWEDIFEENSLLLRIGHIDVLQEAYLKVRESEEGYV